MNQKRDREAIQAEIEGIIRGAIPRRRYGGLTAGGLFLAAVVAAVALQARQGPELEATNVDVAPRLTPTRPSYFIPVSGSQDTYQTPEGFLVHLPEPVGSTAI